MRPEAHFILRNAAGDVIGFIAFSAPLSYETATPAISELALALREAGVEL